MPPNFSALFPHLPVRVMLENVLLRVKEPEIAAQGGPIWLGQICPWVCGHLSERRRGRGSRRSRHVVLAHELPKGAPVFFCRPRRLADIAVIEDQHSPDVTGLKLGNRVRFEGFEGVFSRRPTNPRQ